MDLYFDLVGVYRIVCVVEGMGRGVRFWCMTESRRASRQVWGMLATVVSTCARELKMSSLLDGSYFTPAIS